MTTIRIDPEVAPPVNGSRIALGHWAEAVVRDWCLSQGMTLLAAHVTAAGSELDLIMQQGDRIAICEVRCLLRPIAGVAAVETISAGKLAALRRGAEGWMGTLDPIPPTWHFHTDLYLLEPDPGGGWSLTCIEDIG